MLGNSMVIQWAKGKERRGGDRGSRGGFGDRRGGFRDGGRGGGAPRNLECFKCGGRGHFARDCRASGGNDRYGGSGGRRGGGDRRDGGRRDYGDRRRDRYD